MIYKLYIDSAHAWYIVGGSKKDHDRVTRRPFSGTFLIDGKYMSFRYKGFGFVYTFSDLVEDAEELDYAEEDISALSVVMGIDIKEATYSDCIVLDIDNIDEFNSKFFPLFNDLMRARSL